MACLGTGVQMLAVGPENRFVDVDPQASYFAPAMTKSSRHAVEELEHLPVRATGFGGTAVFEVPVKGDALGRMHVQVGVPAVGASGRWASPLAYALMRRVRLMVDEVTVYDHERLWYRLVDELTVGEGRAAGHADMLGTDLPTDRAHTLFLPLKFFERPRAFFPLALLPNSRIRVELELEGFAACVDAGLSGLVEPRALDLRLVAEHVWLEAEERNAMLVRPRVTMMVEAVQDMEAVNYVESAEGVPMGKPDALVDLSELNLPVRGLVWVVYEEPVTRPFRFLDVVEGATLLYGSLEREVMDRPTCSRRQALSHWFRCPTTPGVHTYSFALDPGGERPSGSANFSAIQKPVLRVSLAPDASRRLLKCKVFALAYNWLQFDGRTVRQVFSV